MLASRALAPITTDSHTLHERLNQYRMDQLLETVLHGDELTLALIASGGNVGPKPGSTITKVLNDVMVGHTTSRKHHGEFYRVGISPDVLQPCLKVLLALCNCGYADAFEKADALMAAHGLGEPYPCDVLRSDEINPG